MTLATVYGRVKTGYAVVSATDLDAWKRFGADGLGLHLDDHGPDLIAFRIDDRERRLIVRRSERGDFDSLGLEVASEEVLVTILDRLDRRGVAVVETTGAEADARGVERYWSVVGPKRMGIELFLNAFTADTAAQIKHTGFNVGDGGMCHLAITTTKPAEMLAFWRDIFDAKTSDTIEDKISGTRLLFTFTRFNERHHSIAVAETRGPKLDPVPTRIQHMAFDVMSTSDVIDAYSRCKTLGYQITMGLGKHPNDQAFSYYVASPSGFEIELGADSLKVNSDLEGWVDGKVHQGISVWGHEGEDVSIRDHLSRARTGVASLFRREFTPLG